MGQRDGDDARHPRGQVTPPPKSLRAFSKAKKATAKTPITGGGLRKRWKDDDGAIYEWDYAHGPVTVGVIARANLTPTMASSSSQLRHPGGLSHDDGYATDSRV